MPKPVEPLSPSDQLIHATEQISEGAAAPIKSTDQIKVPQRHEEHQINGASCVSKQRSPQQIDEKGPNDLVYLSTRSGSLYPLSRVKAPDRIYLNGMGPLHVWDHTKEALNVRHSICSHPMKTSIKGDRVTGTSNPGDSNE